MKYQNSKIFIFLFLFLCISGCEGIHIDSPADLDNKDDLQDDIDGYLPCQQDDDCGPEKYCLNEICQNTPDGFCISNGECLNDEVCLKDKGEQIGYCGSPREIYDLCTSNTDCGIELTCDSIHEECRKKISAPCKVGHTVCESRAYCLPENQNTDEGFCVFKSGFGQPCGEHDHCQKPNLCDPPKKECLNPPGSYCESDGAINCAFSHHYMCIPVNDTGIEGICAAEGEYDEPLIHCEESEECPAHPRFAFCDTKTSICADGGLNRGCLTTEKGCNSQYYLCEAQECRGLEHVFCENDDQCSGSLYCSNDGECSQKKDINEPCDCDQGCSSGHCHPYENYCFQPSGLGESCTDIIFCDGELICNIDICQPMRSTMVPEMCNHPDACENGAKCCEGFCSFEGECNE